MVSWSLLVLAWPEKQVPLHPCLERMAIGHENWTACAIRYLRNLASINIWIMPFRYNSILYNCASSPKMPLLSSFAIECQSSFMPLGVGMCLFCAGENHSWWKIEGQERCECARHCTLLEIWWTEILLMDKILHHQGWWLSHYSSGFNHPRWCRILSINSRSWHVYFFWLGKFSAVLF